MNYPINKKSKRHLNLDEDLEHELILRITIPLLPPVALIAAMISQPEHEEPSPKFEPWKASFYAGTQVQPSRPWPRDFRREERDRTIPQEKSVNKAKKSGAASGSQPDELKRIHRRELPPEPRTHGIS